MRLRLLAASTVLLLAACASAPHASSPTAHSPSATTPRAEHVGNVPLLLVSIDGLRAQDDASMPVLWSIAAHGVHAQSMRPSFPSLTFPNHYTLVTGLYPDHHGIINNTMQDPQLGRFALDLRDAVSDGRWWGGEPIWNSVQKAGGHSATMFWPGSEANIQGMHPTYWQPFDASVTPVQRVQQVLAWLDLPKGQRPQWLDLPKGQRPQMLTLYFDQVDHAEHEHGPDSAEADAARAQIDAALGQLRDGLHARKLDDALNLVIVSDHGMAAVPPDHLVALEDMVATDKVEFAGTGEIVGINPRSDVALQNEFDLKIAPRLRGRHDHYTCWYKEELPLQWHYGSNPRVPQVVCVMDDGWDALPRSTVEKRKAEGTMRGAHGYDPALQSMQASFVAAGPAFRHGVTLPTFDNVDVYSLLAHLLNITPAPNDGDIAPLLPALDDASK